VAKANNMMKVLITRRSMTTALLAYFRRSSVLVCSGRSGRYFWRTLSITSRIICHFIRRLFFLSREQRPLVHWLSVLSVQHMFNIQ